MGSGLTIGQLAKEVGVNIQTVRYYERLKLLIPIARKPSGYRLYGATERQRLSFIKNAQTLGFTLREIRELLSLQVGSIARRGDVQRRAAIKLAQVEAKVKNLQALTRALRSLIRTCQHSQSSAGCPILKSLEENGHTKNPFKERR